MTCCFIENDFPTSINSRGKTRTCILGDWKKNLPKIQPTSFTKSEQGKQAIKKFSPFIEKAAGWFNTHLPEVFKECMKLKDFYDPFKSLPRTMVIPSWFVFVKCRVCLSFGMVSIQKPSRFIYFSSYSCLLIQDSACRNFHIIYILKLLLLFNLRKL